MSFLHASSSQTHFLTSSLSRVLSFSICYATLLLLLYLDWTNFYGANAELTHHFRNFLDARYGAGSSARFERMDMGVLDYGSFGGRRSDSDKLKNQPVIFVHGVMLRAGAFISHRNFFIQHGYSESELYATTYSDGGMTPFFNNRIECASVRQVRGFIDAVYEYTNASAVDVIAYSMGVAVSRKAILGGRCVDTNEELGRSITHKIDAFVAVAGVAYGLESCPPPLPACNAVNGLRCVSKFLREVNSFDHSYEGNVTYAIYSREDNLVGQQCCGHHCSELKHANLTVIRRHYDHFTVFSQTQATQLSLVRYHSANAVVVRDAGSEDDGWVPNESENSGTKTAPVFEEKSGKKKTEQRADLEKNQEPAKA